MLVACLACGPSSTSTATSSTATTSETSGEVEPSELPIAPAPDDPRAVFAAQRAALESRDPPTFVQDFEADAFFIGPVADAVYLGRDAIASALGDVVDASGAISVRAEERHFATHGSVAWSVHDVRIAPAEVDPGAPDSMRFRVSSVYRRAEGWQLAGQAWGVIVPNADYAELSGRTSTPKAIEARADPRCADGTAELTAWLGGATTLWRDNPDVFAAGIDPDELHASTEHLATAGDALAVQPGQGGVRGRALGDDACLLLANQVVENRSEGAQPRGALPYRFVALFVGDALRLAHVVAIVPDASPLTDDDDDGDEDGDDGDDEDGDAGDDAEAQTADDPEAE